MARSGSLFSKYEFRLVLEAQEKELAAAITQIGAEELLTTALDELVPDLVGRFQIVVPTLVESDIHVDHVEIKIEVANHHRARLLGEGPISVPGVRFSYFVPFEGDQELFRCRGSQFSLSPPRAVIEGSELRLEYERMDHDAAAVKREFDRDIEQIRRHLNGLAAEAGTFNSALEGKARAGVIARRDRLKQNSEAAAALGYPLRRRSGAPRTYAVPEVRRKITPRASASDTPARAIEPMLAMSEYDHILSVLQNMVQVMERSPDAFRTLREEDIRTHFLVQLNSQYEGQATGETFNFDGKTDILIRAEGRNIFIAECKFWTGEKGFGEAIDQLMGYLTWRDTKAAILVFNRDRKLSTTISAISRALDSRPEVARRETQAIETSFRVVLRRPDDPDREILLTVLVFELPGSTPA